MCSTFPLCSLTRAGLQLREHIVASHPPQILYPSPILQEHSPVHHSQESPQLRLQSTPPTWQALCCTESLRNRNVTGAIQANYVLGVADSYSGYWADCPVQSSLAEFTLDSLGKSFRDTMSFTAQIVSRDCNSPRSEPQMGPEPGLPAKQQTAWNLVRYLQRSSDSPNPSSGHSCLLSPAQVVSFPTSQSITILVPCHNSVEDSRKDGGQHLLY